MTCTLLVLLAVISVQTYAITLGAPPDSTLYSSGKIACGDVLGVVNDDYCDCEDGSDEPGTSACSNGKFYCLNKGYVGQFIPSSRVGDGICDCCDGSEEASGLCTDNCKELAVIKNSQTLKDIAAHEEGLKAIDEHLLHFYVEKTEKEAKKETLQKEQEEKKAREQVLEKSIEELEEKIKGEKEYLETSFKNDVEAEVAPLLASWVERRQVEIEEAERNRKIKEEEDRVAAEKAAAEAAERGEEKPEEHPEEKHEETPVDLNAETEAEKNRLFNEIMNKKVEESEHLKSLREEKNKLENDELGPLRGELTDIDISLQELNAWFDLDFGPDKRYAYLYGQTFTYHTPQYEYKFTAFKDAAQGHTSIGNWKEWINDHTAMKFDGGVRCWGGPDRSLTIHLECGANTEIYEIREPAKCEYSMKAKTPGMCTHEGLQALKDKLV